MRSQQHVCSVETNDVLDCVDLTDAIRDAFDASRMSDARVTVFATDPGTAIFVNERESGLLSDLKRAAARIVETGAPVVMGSTSVVFPAAGKRLLLGSWQRVFLAELEEPGRREVLVQITGE